LIWLTYVVSVALFAKGFAGYFLPLLNLPANAFSTALTEILLILFFTALNFFGSKAVGKAEFYLVLIKLVILLLFIAGGQNITDPT
jgi:amino acid transporter